MNRVFNGPAFLLFDYLKNPTPENGISLIIRLFATLAIIFIVFPFHEFAHAFSAKLLGDETAERNGRLTLNPFAHIDPLGAIVMLFLPIGWAKPVPIEPRNATRKVTIRGFISLTAAAGPLSNIILSFIMVLISKIILLFPFTEITFYLTYALNITAQLSVYLAIFNLIPIPPLDGSKILYFFLKTNQIMWLEQRMNTIRTIFLLAIFIDPFDTVVNILGFGSNAIMNGINFILSFIK